MSPSALRRLCGALLLLQLAYCATALIVGPPLPAWSMFSRVEPLDFALRGRDGRPVDLLREIRRGYYITNAGQLAEAVACVCRAHPELKPLRFESSALGLSGDPCP